MAILSSASEMDSCHANLTVGILHDQLGVNDSWTCSECHTYQGAEFKKCYVCDNPNSGAAHVTQTQISNLCEQMKMWDELQVSLALMQNTIAGEKIFIIGGFLTKQEMIKFAMLCKLTLQITQEFFEYIANIQRTDGEARRLFLSNSNTRLIQSYVDSGKHHLEKKFINEFVVLAIKNNVNHDKMKILLSHSFTPNVEFFCAIVTKICGLQDSQTLGNTEKKERIQQLSETFKQVLLRIVKMSPKGSFLLTKIYSLFGHDGFHNTILINKLGLYEYIVEIDANLEKNMYLKNFADRFGGWFDTKEEKSELLRLLPNFYAMRNFGGRSIQTAL